MAEPTIGKLILDQFKLFRESQARIEHELMEIKNRLAPPASEGEREAMRSFFEERASLKDMEEKLLPIKDLAVLAPKDFNELLELTAVKLKQLGRTNEN
jgi:hypothetical protein